MTDGRRERRGSYAKGVAKREEILTRALDVIAREGIRGASVKELADAVGLSQAGLLHYFDSKEHLFTELLRKRDEVDYADAGLGSDIEHLRNAEGDVSLDRLRRAFVGVVRHNAEVPGLVQLFARLSVDAADAAHPAHEFFVQRGAALREVVGQTLARHQTDGDVAARVDPETLARLFQAVADGLQLQWMLEPDVDMAAILDALFDVVRPQPREGSTDA